MSVKSIETHLAKVAFGDEMAKLEAYQTWSIAAKKAGLKIDFCGNCGIPSAEKLGRCENIDCGKYICERSFCRDVVVHKCSKGGTDRKYCHIQCRKCEWDSCDNTICDTCRTRCPFCRETFCVDHVVELHGTAACVECINRIYILKKRKIEK